MTLQTKLRALYEPFRALDCPVYHYHRADPSERYVVWAEDGENTSFHADGSKQEQQLTGVVDFYTKTEFDAIADDIQSILVSERIGWHLDSVQYEEETGLIHFQWRWYLG